MKTSLLIPARGTVEFLIFTDGYGPEPSISIDGPKQWLRPAVGLVRRHWDSDWRATAGLPDDLPYEPVVVDEIGSFYTVYDYLEYVMGGCHWDHATHFYRPHIDGPVSDAPRVRVLFPSSPVVDSSVIHDADGNPACVIGTIRDTPEPGSPPSVTA